MLIRLLEKREKEDFTFIFKSMLKSKTSFNQVNLASYTRLCGVEVEEIHGNSTYTRDYTSILLFLSHQNGKTLAQQKDGSDLKTALYS